MKYAPFLELRVMTQKWKCKYRNLNITATLKTSMQRCGWVISSFSKMFSKVVCCIRENVSANGKGFVAKSSDGIFLFCMKKLSDASAPDNFWKLIQQFLHLPQWFLLFSMIIFSFFRGYPYLCIDVFKAICYRFCCMGE